MPLDVGDPRKSLAAANSSLELAAVVIDQQDVLANSWAPSVLHLGVQRLEDRDGLNAGPDELARVVIDKNSPQPYSAAFRTPPSVRSTAISASAPALTAPLGSNQV